MTKKTSLRSNVDRCELNKCQRDDNTKSLWIPESLDCNSSAIWHCIVCMKPNPIAALARLVVTALFAPIFQRLGGRRPRSGSARITSAASVARRPRRKDRSMAWVMSRDDWVVLDVEATGYSEHSEIIEIAILNPTGAVVMEQRVLPKGRIPSAATDVHGITRQMLRDCPRWPEIDATVRQHLAGKRVIAYNAEYEQRLLTQTAEKWGLPSIDILGHCAMLAYAEHRGIIGRDGYKWHKLVEACRYEGIPISGAHSAVADARNALALVLKMARGEQAKLIDENQTLPAPAAAQIG
jgi:DNA polymerase-3 subunit epsilon